ncbi:hypothetical protein IEZ30_06645 [Chromobacterium haemolyticum]|nr:hypothetical protein IEZ30_06645 [Chromobacterium haemolyticum]
MPHITNLPTYEEATEAVKAGTASALDRFIYNNEPAGPTEEEFREGLLAALDEARAELSPATAQSAPIEAIQLVCDALTAIVANSGDPAGTVNTLAQWRTRAEAFIQNHGKPKEGERLAAEMALSQQLAARVDDLERQLAIAQRPTSTQPATVPEGWRDAAGKAYHFMQDIGEHGVTCAIYDLDEDGKHIQCSCGMDETLRSLNALLATVPQPAQAEQHSPAPLAAARAIEAAAAAIYLADSSDYLGAMWTVLRWLSPDIAALMEKDERAAWGLACTRLTAEANQERTPDANH